MGMCPYEGHELVDDKQDPGDGRELEKDPPVCVLILLLVELVMQGQDTSSDQIAKEGTANVAERILAEPFPRRMGGTEEDWLRACTLDRGRTKA